MNRYGGTLILSVGLIGFGVLVRIMPHTANFSPMMAIALFSGFLLQPRYGLAVPLVTMAVSDFIIGFHGLSLVVWACYIIAAYLANKVLKKPQIKQPLVLAAWMSVGFFLVTNFAVWAEGRLYPPTWAGLWNSYAAAWPFFRVSLISDIVYTSLLFGLYTVLIKQPGLLRKTRKDQAA